MTERHRKGFEHPLSAPGQGADKALGVNSFRHNVARTMKPAFTKIIYFATMCGNRRNQHSFKSLGFN